MKKKKLHLTLIKHGNGFKEEKKKLKVIYRFTKKCLLISFFIVFHSRMITAISIMIILIVINAVRKFKVMMYIMYKYPGKMCDTVHYLKVLIFAL